MTEKGLFPGIFNLATIADISVNATCGEGGVEEYCRLVEHVRRRPTDRTQCGLCSNRSLDEEERHPITNAVDGTNRWWQSPSIAQGRRYEWVTITVDLKQVRWLMWIHLFKIYNTGLPAKHFKPIKICILRSNLYIWEKISYKTI